MNENSNSETKEKILLEIYKDAAQPAIRAVGNALGTCLEFVTSLHWRLKLRSEKAKLTFQKNLEKYAEELAKIPEEKRCEVHQQIGLPILDKLTYTTEEDIANLFIILLLNASNQDMVHTVLPAFISMISELSPDEARILNYLKDKEDIAYCNFRGVNIKNGKEILSDICCSTIIPDEVKLEHKDNVIIYLNNFVRLGILVDYKTSSYQLADTITYNRIQDTYLEKLKNDLVPNKYQHINILKSFYEITELGKRFIQACTKNTLKKA